MSEEPDVLVKIMDLNARISSGLALHLWKTGILSQEDASPFADLLRELARAYEPFHEVAATELWTAANLLQRLPPSSRE